jgi:hypothetical protein
VLDAGTIEAALTAACADAGVDPRTVVVWIVAAVRPPGTTPLAYLQPAGSVRADTVRVFQAVGEERASHHRLRAHRLAVWGALPGIPEAALGPMLRHELEHARRWEVSGPGFFEADDLLRAAVRAAGGEGYGALPSEREANAATAAYSARMLSGAQLAALRADGELRGLLAPEPPPEDIVAATFSALARHADPASVQALRAACEAWDRTAEARMLRREGPLVEVVPARS